jgi:Zn finger protein HypA/HybF involved in hydrogenase expression
MEVKIIHKGKQQTCSNCQKLFFTTKGYDHCIVCRQTRDDKRKDKVRESYMKYYRENYEKLYPRKTIDVECECCHRIFRSKDSDNHCGKCKKKGLLKIEQPNEIEAH